jgi:hypothetical protein
MKAGELPQGEPGVLAGDLFWDGFLEKHYSILNKVLESLVIH